MALKKAGLPWSYKAILKYERMGVIQRPANTIPQASRKGIRIYTSEEIKQIVQKMKEHKHV